MVTIVLLVFLLGTSLSGLTGWGTLLTLGWGLGFAVAILALTAGFVLLLPRPKASTLPLPTPADHPFPLGPFLAVTVVAGYGFGRLVPLPSASLLSWLLYALLALVAFDLRWSWRAMRSIGGPLTAAILAAVVAGLLVGWLTPLGIREALASSLGFGWYTLAGPLVTARLGAVAGLFAFLTNFLRENLTMVLAPRLGRRLRGEGLTALGGATAMDTTLYFVVRYGDPEAGALALSSGFVLTLLASLLLPLVLGISIA